MTKKQKNILMLIVLVIGAGAIAAMSYFSGDTQSTTPPSTIQQPLQSQSFTPQPAGDVPPGKVWSPEHGHWHDAGITTNNQALSIPGQVTPQPAGQAPSGKVWSAEHGHWHDAPGVLEIKTQNTTNATPPDSQ